MKKVLVKVTIGLVLLLVLGVVALGLFLDRMAKTGIETVGPMVTKVSVEVDEVDLSVLSGAGHVKGMVVGNPEGFKTPASIKVGTARVEIEPGSLLSDKIVIRSVDVREPEITYETDLKGSNLGKILENVQAVAGGTEPGKPASPEEAKAPRKFQVDEFIIEGGKIHLSMTALGGKTAVVPLPEIRLANLGQGPEGITAADLTKVVLRELQKTTAEAAAAAVKDLGAAAVDLGKDVGAAAANEAAEKVTKGITDIFKKKE